MEDPAIGGEDDGSSLEDLGKELEASSMGILAIACSHVETGAIFSSGIGAGAEGIVKTYFESADSASSNKN